MKTAIYIIIILIGFLFLSGAKISLNPFSIQLKNWPFAVGIYLMIIGVSFIKYDGYRNGKIEAYKEIKEIIESFKPQNNE